MTDEYVSTQRYKAFFWNGSNIDDVYQFLNENNLGWRSSIDTDDFITFEASKWQKCVCNVCHITDIDNPVSIHQLMLSTPKWIVVRLMPLNLEVYDVALFNKSFKKVKE